MDEKFELPKIGDIIREETSSKKRFRTFYCLFSHIFANLKYLSGVSVGLPNSFYIIKRNVCIGCYNS